MAEMYRYLQSLLSSAVDLATRVVFWFFLNFIFVILLIYVDLFTEIRSKWWWSDIFSISSNLFTGGFVSFLIYFLLGFYPERTRRSLLKNNLLHMYLSMKKDILFNVVFASIKGGREDLQAGYEEIEALMSPDVFKATFSGGGEANEGFYAFENQMMNRTVEFENIVLNLKLLSKQISFFLNNYEIKDENLFSTLKRIELVLLTLQESKPGYDESKGLCRFLFGILAGFSFADGYHGEDKIESAIRSIRV